VAKGPLGDVPALLSCSFVRKTKVDAEGGTPEQLTDYPSLCPVVSPDGKWILSYYRAETKAPWKLAIIPF